MKIIGDVSCAVCGEEYGICRVDPPGAPYLPPTCPLCGWQPPVKGRKILLNILPGGEIVFYDIKNDQVRSSLEMVVERAKEMVVEGAIIRVLNEIFIVTGVFEDWFTYKTFSRENAGWVEARYTYEELARVVDMGGVTPLKTGDNDD